jgi:hypothetical protein
MPAQIGNRMPLREFRSQKNERAAIPEGRTGTIFVGSEGTPAFAQ